MLPFWGMRDPARGRSIYAHHTAANAINDFISAISAGEEIYKTAVSSYAIHMYEAAANGLPFFLDKTPRYYLMLPMLKQLFPEAKIILLTRNPLAVLSSICSTFYRGRFMWPDYWIDWDEGHEHLAKAIAMPSANQKLVRYEDLVTQPEYVIRDLCKWLGIAYCETMLIDYRASFLHGRMGDPKGVNTYSSVETSSLDKWQHHFLTSYRCKVARKMLDRIGNERLSTIGYPRSEIEKMLYKVPRKKNIDLNGRLEFLLGELAVF